MKSNEQRCNERHHLNLEIDLIIPSTGEVFGRLCDLSSQGLMVICDTHPDVGKSYEVSLQIPTEDIALDLKLICRWTQMGELEDCFDAGFQVEEITEVQGQILLELAKKHDFFSGLTLPTASKA